jgi:hypothetical protein
MPNDVGASNAAFKIGLMSIGLKDGWKCFNALLHAIEARIFSDILFV